MDTYCVALTVLHVSGIILLLFGRAEGLNCWHCIADNCEANPEENYKASQKPCLQGQQCQKVYFQMQSDVKTTKYTSVVRSCAEQCLEQDDFLNCTEWQLTTRGCVRKTCCNDEDLCNGAGSLHVSPLRLLGTLTARRDGCWSWGFWCVVIVVGVVSRYVTSAVMLS